MRKNQIIERYGVYEEFECDNPESLIEQTTLYLKKLKETQKDNKNLLKKVDKELRDFLVVEKDLTRIVENAGMTVFDVAFNDDELEEITQLNDYEMVQKEFNRILKQEDKKKDEFRKGQAKLVEKLTNLNALELATEIRESIMAPDCENYIVETVKNIDETIDLIRLEKDRIVRGLADMEKIKENFETRCLQICLNVKSELDKLPKLSNITMDNESIAIVSMVIPYISEDLQRGRMSEYIDETVSIAQSFKDVAERLKYIRSRLTWKRLFSVIVNDMNAIRVNLYKRERIKEQSRYLRYEEAVGSTGQSQGIYIQFLISIINYISSINATKAENSVIGKTIFIDNPFGAAKDIYIWEPIFRLLKTNHVQLIVPARGATPAITGRFEVNYILGQKMSDNRQQTVVVEYNSSVNAEEVEYKKVDYEQTTFIWE